ncbi:patatin-like phospholipase family protein [Psychrobacter celer]|uniref:patatin-like phospholipase family protein n=1 Tax=Psychrobacter celer TaxID=306572 RepID=UPI003FD3AA9A
MTNKHTTYERVQLFSGGGSRFAYYLGSYAALVAHDLRPDMIIGTCGGSLSAYLVHLAPEPKDLQALLYSHELYTAICAIRHVRPDEANRRLKMRYITQAIQRWRLASKQSAKPQRSSPASYEQLLAELQQLAMFRIDDERYWLDALSGVANERNERRDKNACGHKRIQSTKQAIPEVAIIASRLQKASGVDSAWPPASYTAAGPAAVLQELLFASPRVATMMSLAAAMQGEADNKIRSPAHAFADGRIPPHVQIVSQWRFADAIRASMADMYYLPPTHISALGWCLGGVINLTPVELACQLGQTVFAESKAGYDTWLAAPAIKRVFGFDPNARLAQVHGYQREASHRHTEPLHWLPFADNAEQLAGQSVQKRFSIKQMTVALIHRDYDGFVQQMQAQWQYGYQRTSSYIRQHAL